MPQKTSTQSLLSIAEPQASPVGHHSWILVEWSLALGLLGKNFFPRRQPLGLQSPMFTTTILGGSLLVFNAILAIPGTF
jgi:hypothetical protein